MSETTTKAEAAIKILLSKASNSTDSADAQRFSQAAVNAAHAVNILNQTKREEAG